MEASCKAEIKEKWLTHQLIIPGVEVANADVPSDLLSVMPEKPKFNILTLDNPDDVLASKLVLPYHIVKGWSDHAVFGKSLVHHSSHIENEELMRMAC